MGNPDPILIPAAILLHNPGLTREEFSAKILDTYLIIKSESPPAPLDFAKGVYGLPKILSLPTREGFRKFRKANRKVDDYGMRYGDTKLKTSLNRDKLEYIVSEHIVNSFGEEQKYL